MIKITDKIRKEKNCVWYLYIEIGKQLISHVSENWILESGKNVLHCRNQSDISVVKSIGCFSGEPRIDSQHPYGD